MIYASVMDVVGDLEKLASLFSGVTKAIRTVQGFLEDRRRDELITYLHDLHFARKGIPAILDEIAAAGRGKAVAERGRAVAALRTRLQDTAADCVEAMQSLSKCRDIWIKTFPLNHSQADLLLMKPRLRERLDDFAECVERGELTQADIRENVKRLQEAIEEFNVQLEQLHSVLLDMRQRARSG